MKYKMVWIDAHGTLYRGFGREYPAIVWCPKEKQWAVSDIPTPCDWDWGALVTIREAERCYPGSTSAPPPDGIEIEAEIDLMKYRPELFDFYDGPIYRKSPEEEAEERRQREVSQPDYMRERGAEVQIARCFGKWNLPDRLRWRWFLRMFWIVQRPHVWGRRSPRLVGPPMTRYSAGRSHKRPRNPVGKGAIR